MQKEKARALLKQMLGQDAEFRDGQWEAIDRVANGRQRLLVVQRTGRGKSLVYFLASKILRDAGAGPALLISPLLSLMRNQILAAEKLGIHALTVHSENLDEWKEIEAALEANRCNVLLVAPERLANGDFLQKLLPLFMAKSASLSWTSRIASRIGGTIFVPTSAKNPDSPARPTAGRPTWCAANK